MFRLWELHRPVLMKEVMHFLNPSPGKVIIDATVGGGGHAEEIARRISPGGILIGIDKDSESLKIVSERLKVKDIDLKLINRDFRKIKQIVDELNIGEVDGILCDLGISSIQMETAERGFSIKNNGPLDMRMDRKQEIMAREIINNFTESELSSLIKDLGEDRFAKRIARGIVNSRRKKKIESTSELANIVLRSIPYSKKKWHIHPATRTFQALRIIVNDELGAIEDALMDMPAILKKGGRVCMLSFHSLEDRIVKTMFRNFKSEGVFSILTKKPVRPGEDEVLVNPRARSVKLRAAEKI